MTARGILLVGLAMLALFALTDVRIHYPAALLFPAVLIVVGAFGLGKESATKKP